MLVFNLSGHLDLRPVARNCEAARIVRVQQSRQRQFIKSMKNESDLKREVEPAAQASQDENGTGHFLGFLRPNVFLCASFS